MIVVKADLRDMFGPPRNQGSRPTCTAFACSDLHAAFRAQWNLLSCEYVFYHGVRMQNTNPHKGIRLSSALEIIHKSGQPLETAWPYLPVLPTDQTKWIPPKSLGKMFRSI